jgi:hypothetical protein
MRLARGWPFPQNVSNGLCLTVHSRAVLFSWPRSLPPPCTPGRSRASRGCRPSRSDGVDAPDAETAIKNALPLGELDAVLRLARRAELTLRRSRNHKIRVFPCGCDLGAIFPATQDICYVPMYRLARNTKHRCRLGNIVNCHGQGVLDLLDCHPGTPIGLVCTIALNAAVAPDLPTYCRWRPSETLGDPPDRPARRDATGNLFAFLKP